jgi:hypothetical protein
LLTVTYSVSFCLASFQPTDEWWHLAGLTDIEIHFLQIKYNAIGIYLHKSDALLLQRLDKWKGKTAEELAGDDAFFDALVSAPVEKLVRVVVIKEIKGSQYGVQLESAVRDRLVAADKYEDDEEEALERLTGFFQSKYFKPSSVVTFHFPTTPGPAQARTPSNLFRQSSSVHLTEIFANDDKFIYIFGIMFRYRLRRKARTTPRSPWRTRTWRGWSRNGTSAAPRLSLLPPCEAWPISSPHCSPHDHRLLCMC